ncbi:hypothetical protein RDWZM_005118 [Blomia tropicalis]|uniref:Phosphatidic acid phosphatase type 2/haloperoxidase domain-containing protein n=1 Tax=Blomia tropicalis TaxID=40697 RepID=A0A9Q0RM32_BLOTA|nr:hypothetical protein RDWZM_005118 [Blomia tropicalis]
MFQIHVTYRSILLVLALFVITFQYFVPYQRGFNCSDRTIQHPFKPLLVPSKWLFIFSLLVPLIFIFICKRLFSASNRSMGTELTKFAFGFIVNLTFTEITKRTFGRLRPHTYHFCDLSRYCINGPSDIWISSFECINADSNEIMLTNARLSFFSGHSSLGSFAGTYLTWFIHRYFIVQFVQPSKNQIRLILSMFIELSIFLVYLYPGYTQWLIYWHHLTDVLTGFTVGIFIATATFHLVNQIEIPSVRPQTKTH